MKKKFQSWFNNATISKKWSRWSLKPFCNLRLRPMRSRNSPRSSFPTIVKRSKIKCSSNNKSNRLSKIGRTLWIKSKNMTNSLKMRLRRKENSLMINCWTLQVFGRKKLKKMISAIVLERLTPNIISPRNGQTTMVIQDIPMGRRRTTMRKCSSKLWNTSIFKQKIIKTTRNTQNSLRDWTKRNNSKLSLKKDSWNFKNSKRNMPN